MPVRPPGLIRQTIGDNVQQVEQAPTVTGEEQFFANVSEEFSISPGSSITSTIHVYDRGDIYANEDHIAYAFGDDNGDVYVVRADTGAVVASFTGFASDDIVSIDHRTGTFRPEIVVALSEDGNLYGFDVLGGGQSWSFTVGGTPKCFVKAEGDVAFVGQPEGQSDEFYAVDATGTGSGGTVNWTYTASGGFSGDIETDDTYVYAVGAKTAFRLDKASGSADWTTQLETTATALRNFGRFSFDSDNWYLEINVGNRSDVYSVDKSTGSKNWEDSVSEVASLDDNRAHCLVSGERLFVYPRPTDGVAALDKTNGSEFWTNNNLDPTGDNNGNLIDVNFVDVGSVVVASAGPLTSTPGEVVGFRKDGGSQSFAIDAPHDVELALGENKPEIAFGAGSDLSEYNLATTGTFGPIRVGSRPFATLGADSVGQFDVIVKGKNDETGTALEQDTLTFDGGAQAEQLPWWSWEYAEFEIVDKNVSAGDTTLYLSASR